MRLRAIFLFQIENFTLYCAFKNSKLFGLRLLTSTPRDCLIPTEQIVFVFDLRCRGSHIRPIFAGFSILETGYAIRKGLFAAAICLFTSQGTSVTRQATRSVSGSTRYYVLRLGRVNHRVYPRWLTFKRSTSLLHCPTIDTD